MRIRVGSQHTGAAVDAAKKFKEFGLGYPPDDWPRAWEVVRARVTGAVDAIRQAVETRTQ